jgi:hypothetical protein
MEKDTFKSLPIDSYFHDPKAGDEWKVKSHEDNSVFAICTRTGSEHYINLGDMANWEYNSFAHIFEVGKYHERKPKFKLKKPRKVTLRFKGFLLTTPKYNVVTLPQRNIKRKG